ncbi:MAG: amidophosphoribosyltransferase [Deltaproteobacteria bacterium HGW-Deltaproteobacteria-14]|nr:MAG: amidophosphoribosyltransferase [Deltaproteobacteria bacterium HGW-Deltaproteobacteria-14]
MRSPFDSRPHEECGVFAVHAEGADVARLTFFALYALQHRGQESAGIATCKDGEAHVHKGMGLVTQVFKEEHLKPLVGDRAIGHTRYSTTGASHLRNAQPYLLHTTHGPVGVAHNGNLTNARQLRQGLLARGVGLVGESDTEVIAQLLAAPTDGGTPGAPDWEGRIARFMAVAEGAYSLTILTPGALFAVRDPYGFRPLCLGELETEHGRGWAAASESSAFVTIGGRFLREVRPGEVVRIDKSGITAHQAPVPPRPASLCVFEYVYFARPDSRFEGQMVHQARQRLGRELAREAPCGEADLVIPVPDSSVAAAIGYASESGLPYNEGLMKNRYIGRTFIAPTDELRKAGVRLKFNAIDQNLAGKRVVMVDDSIVRGNTAGKIVSMLRDGGAREVHVRVSSPPVRHPCFMGVDMGTYEELIGHRLDVAGIRDHIGADTLAYLSHDGLMRAVMEGVTGGPGGHCSACFSGIYPIKVAGR